MKSSRIWIVATLWLLVGTAFADEDTIAVQPDLSAAQHQELQRALGCGVAEGEVNVLGCELLATFMMAKAPDEKLFKTDAGSGGRRWLGFSVVVGHASEGEWGVVDERLPRLNAHVLGLRYSRNFHEKIHFPNGASPTYVWPQSQKQGLLIQQAVDEMRAAQSLPATNPLMKFGKVVNLNYSAVHPTQGQSVKIGEASLFMRQQGNDLYVVELGGKDEDHPKYWITRVSLQQSIVP